MVLDALGGALKRTRWAALLQSSRKGNHSAGRRKSPSALPKGEPL
ncbi:hypothetical protein DT23_11355 [Thioclava indica]|uniref:Uncharacterized protein n=1 Tax=Thioclava indica TaxID=1353528 RepID=A0A074JWW5_9RHOB|nr:hypothetical protein DT23_11355 [Thioclava indica]